MQRRRALASLASFAAMPWAAAAAPPADAGLWQRLRAGGLVLLLRHAATDPGVGDPPGFQLAQCATQRNLSEDGRRDARRIGATLRARGVPLGPVWSSRWCRCLETARLAFGRVEAAPMLDSMFDDDAEQRHAKVRKTLAAVAARRGNDNLVLVTHDVNIRALTRRFVAPGEIVVARADPKGAGFVVLGTLLAHAPEAPA